MGQQQLLLLVLGVIVVGIAVFVGIQLFQSSMLDQKRNLIVKECINLASMAQQYYKKPKTLGGGGNSFTGWKITDEMISNTLNRYDATVQPEKITVTATGDMLVNETDSLKVTMEIYPNDYKITPNN